MQIDRTWLLNPKTHFKRDTTKLLFIKYQITKFVNHFHINVYFLIYKLSLKMEIALLLVMNKCISIYNSRHFPPQLINGSLITTVDDVSSRFFFTIFLSCFVFAICLYSEWRLNILIWIPLRNISFRIIAGCVYFWNDSLIWFTRGNSWKFNFLTIQNMKSQMI